MALIFVLLRTLLKLYLERQAGVPGSRFRTKMVLGALVLSLAPVIAMFLFAYGLMNRSIDKWFSQPVEEVRQDTRAVADLLLTYAGQNAQAEATPSRPAPDTKRAYRPEISRRWSTSSDGMRRHCREVLLWQSSTTTPKPASMRPICGRCSVPSCWLRQGKTPYPVEFDGREYMLGTAPVTGRGRIMVALPLPANLSSTLAQIEQSQQRYLELQPTARRSAGPTWVCCCC